MPPVLTVYSLFLGRFVVSAHHRPRLWPNSPRIICPLIAILARLFSLALFLFCSQSMGHDHSIVERAGNARASHSGDVNWRASMRDASPQRDRVHNDIQYPRFASQLFTQEYRMSKMGESHKHPGSLNMPRRAYGRSQCHEKYPQHRDCSAVSRTSRL